MGTKLKLKIAAGVAVCLLAGTIVVTARTKKRDRDSALFYSELERNISPADIGLAQSDAFDMYYWQNLGKKIKKSYYMLTQRAAMAFVNDIISSWGFFTDNNDKIYSVFRAMKDQVQVSFMAYTYYQKTKINLIDDMRSRMNKDRVGQIMKIVNALPPYRLPETKK